MEGRHAQLRAVGLLGIAALAVAGCGGNDRAAVPPADTPSAVSGHELVHDARTGPLATALGPPRFEWPHPAPHAVELDAPLPNAVESETLTVYASLPRHGPSAAAARDAEAGMRFALANAGARAGGRDIRFVQFSSTRPGDARWSAERIAANVRRSVRDPSAIAYIGELDAGASSISLPTTNSVGLLQVSPADGLTSLGRALPGESSAGSERYVRDGRPTFVRFVPPDLDSARRIAESLVDEGVRRLAIVHDGRIAGRELAQLVLVGALDDVSPRIAYVEAIVRTQRGLDETLERTLAVSPDAILYAGAAGKSGRALLGALAARMPGVPVVGGPQLALGAEMDRTPPRTCAWTGVAAVAQLPPRGRRLLALMRRRHDRHLSTHAILGHASMRLVLNAIDKAGARRRGVIRAARANVDWDDVAVGYGLGNRAHVEPLAVACLKR